jgi:hypothetical protein
MLNEQVIIRINMETVLREEEEGAFLFDPDTGRLCHLNTLGVILWKICKDGKRPQELVEAVLADYPEISKEQVEGDCEKFLGDLEGFGFISMEPVDDST